MHIPNQMIEGAICPVTATVSAVGIVAAAYFAYKSDEKPKAARFGAVAALIFALQMLNFPIQAGTSGHLIGAILAVSILGPPFGILAMGMVVTVQCLVFADGGLTVLGANILNMVLIASIPGIFLHKIFFRKKNKKNIKDLSFLGLACWASVILAAIACSLELGMSDKIGLFKILPAMIGTHALIGIGEVLITVSFYKIITLENFTSTEKRSFGIPILGAGIVALILSPFASSSPDGLEWVAGKLGFLKEGAPAFARLFSDYQVPFIKSEYFSTGLAGLLGVVVIFLGVLSIQFIVKRVKVKKI